MLDVRALTVDDLDAARGLSTRAGWNQMAADWKRFLTLSPGGCFAGVVDGEVVATTAVIIYGGSVSWIGMVLVDERHRSRGYGSRIFERGLEYATSEGGSVVGLDATHLGEPIYRKYGFERVEPVFRWQGTLRPSGSEGGTRTLWSASTAFHRRTSVPFVTSIESTWESIGARCSESYSRSRTFVDISHASRRESPDTRSIPSFVPSRGSSKGRA
jgi:GNAT superfamily N-acetyltransferase